MRSDPALSQGRDLKVSAAYLTLQEIVERELRRDIASGTFALGSHLSERELTERYGVSRGPIREVLKALEVQGLLVRTRGNGVQVARLSVEEMRELYEMRVVLEGLAVQKAIVAAKPGEFEDLQPHFQRLDEMRADDPRWLEANNAFHCAIYRVARRPRLLQAIQQLMAQVEPYMRLYLDDPDHVQQSIDEHAPIWNAVLALDARRCEELTRAHLRTAGALMETLVARRPDPEKQRRV